MRTIKLKTNRLRPFMTAWFRRISMAFAAMAGTATAAFAQKDLSGAAQALTDELKKGVNSIANLATAIVAVVGVFMVGYHFYQARNGEGQGNSKLFVMIFEFLLTIAIIQGLKLIL